MGPWPIGCREGIDGTRFEPIGSGKMELCHRTLLRRLGSDGWWLGQVGRALPRTPTCRPLPSSGAQLALESTRLWFWNNHQEVIHLVALHKVILLQQLVARLRCLTKYHIAGHPMIFAISVAVDNSNFGP